MLDQLQFTSTALADTAPLPALSAAAFVELSYSPALLLDSSFSAVLTGDRAFHSACEYGFDGYFEDMYQWNGDESVFVAQSYSWADVIAFVLENVLHCKVGDRLTDLPPIAWDAGFVLGWLSAHALVDRPMSLLALEVLRTLIELVSCQVVKR